MFHASLGIFSDSMSFLAPTRAGGLGVLRFAGRDHGGGEHAAGRNVAREPDRPGLAPPPPRSTMGLAAAPLARCGGLVSGAAAAWDASSASLVVASGRHVRVHSVPLVGTPAAAAGPGSAARRPRTLAAHDQDVVAVATLGPARALSASEDGTLRVWDTDDAVCLRTIDVGEPVRGVAAPNHSCAKWDGCVAVACAAHVYMVSVTDKRAAVRVLWTTGMDRVACDAGGALVVASAGNVMSIVRRGGTGGPDHRDGRETVGDGRDGRSEGGGEPLRRTGEKKGTKGTTRKGKAVHALARKSFTLPHPITAVAVSPDGTAVAVGDSSGVLHVYRDVAGQMADVPSGRGDQWRTTASTAPSRLHWHASPVTSLQFTAGGTVLLSGAAEAVLVSWKMTRTDFGDRSFRPRLGGAIWGISASPDDRMYAVTCADNAVRVLDACSMSLLAIFQGLAVPPPSSSSSASAVVRSQVLQHVRKMTIVPEPGRDGCVLVTGVGGAVQVYDVYRGEHVGFFPVVPRNLVHMGGDRNLKPRPPSVRHARMSADGDSMATVEVQYSAEEQEILRFWHRSGGELDTLEMVCRIENPHGAAGRVTAVEFHPLLPVVATSSSSGTVKLWRLVDTGAGSRPLTWRCESVQSHRGFACSALSFSPDGSLLAVAAGSTVALWCVADRGGGANGGKKGHVEGSVAEGSPSSLTAELLHSFVHPPSNERVLDVAFAAGSLPAVVSTTRNGLYVWNVLAQCVWWSLRLVTGGGQISVDQSMKRFAVAVDVAKAQPEETCGKRKKSKAGKSPAPEQPDAHSDEAPDAAAAAAACAVSRAPTASRRALSGGVPPGVDKSLVVFDVGSPVPLCVHRLPHGGRLLAASFVSLPRKDMSGDGLCPLVYVDGDLEVHVIADDDESDLLSVVTDEAAEAEGASADDPGHRLDALLGADWRAEAEDRAAASAGRALAGEKRVGSSDVTASLVQAFAGHAHAQAPVSVTAMAAIAELVKVITLSSCSSEGGEREAGARTPSGDRGSGVDGDGDEMMGAAAGAAGRGRRGEASAAHATAGRPSLVSKGGRNARLARFAAISNDKILGR